MIPKTITITHLGAETSVTRSCHLVRFQPDNVGGITILVDCGIAQGHDQQVPFDRFPVPPADAAGDHPIRFNHLYAVEKFQDHQHLLQLKGPAVIIAGSGMCTGGRIVSHLKHGLDDPINDMFFVGFQAKGTPGRAIVEGRTPQ